MRRLLAIVLIMSGPSVPAFAAAPGPRIEVPIRQVNLPNGDRR
jgi:hypothetical protein